MDTKSSMNMNFMHVPGAPPAPPMYPTMENQHSKSQETLSPPVYFHSANPGDQQNHQQRAPSAVPDSRPTSVFIVNGPPPVGPEPLKTHCQHCNTYQTSKVVSRVSLKTHFAAMICCVLGLVCLVPIPYCMNAFKNLHHYCNNCGQYLGSYPAK